MKPLIITEGLEITYNEGKSNEFKALQKVDTEIFPGEYIILFGPSGSGKSTLMYSVLGVLPPSSGKVIVNGDSIYDYSPKEMVDYQRSYIGIIYQSFNLIPSLSVVDNVALPQIFSSVTLAQRKKRAMELLDRFGVSHVADKLTTNLSGGQMQRVAVSRSLVNDPKILLADEPVGNLDAVSATQVMDTLERVNMEDGKTVILVTHDAKHLPYAHRVYYVNSGKIIRDVPNPEKKQIKKTEGHGIVTEIELLAKKFPYDTIEQLRVKSAVNYLTQDMNFKELAVLERAVEAVIDGRLGRTGLFNLLNTPIDDGGVGMTKAQSKNITDEMMKIMDQAQDITRYRQAIEEDKLFYYQYKYVKRVKDYLLENYSGIINETQRKNLEDIVSRRLSGALKAEEFEEKLNADISDGGVHLNTRTALNLSSYMEKLIAQGVEYVKKGEEYIGEETEQT
ncbi:MAG: ABC transporter ATP-binding protein [Candidatus Spechtbacterales bacterium]|nr:ABC transporter ATP-binding protein [Candidatus Spechtbacterales bacterium]